MCQFVPVALEIETLADFVPIFTVLETCEKEAVAPLFSSICQFILITEPSKSPS
jgi:hypothetical protein